MRIALDTNRYTDLAKRVPDVVRFVGSASAVYLPFAVTAELGIGFRRGSRRAANEAALQANLSQFGMQVLYPDARTVQVFADLSCELLVRGALIPINDIWIAALAVQHGLTLYTRDKHFDRLPQVLRA